MNRTNHMERNNKFGTCQRQRLYTVHIQYWTQFGHIFFQLLLPGGGAIFGGIWIVFLFDFHTLANIGSTSPFEIPDKTRVGGTLPSFHAVPGHALCSGGAPQPGAVSTEPSELCTAHKCYGT